MFYLRVYKYQTIEPLTLARQSDVLAGTTFSYKSKDVALLSPCTNNIVPAKIAAANFGLFIISLLGGCGS